ncbi:MAG: TlpA disulfide reductase family protein [Thermodesulfobacteriota bacterium]
MNFLLKRILFILVGCGIVISPFNRLLQTSALAASQVQPAKNFSLKNLDSKKVSLSDFRGRVVLVNFFATWCPPCRQEIPELIKIFKENNKRGLAMVGISMDTDEFPHVIKNFTKKMKIPYPILIGNEEVAYHYRVMGIPATFLIDKEGKIYQRFDGLVSKDLLEKTIKELLSAKSQPGPA